MADVGVILQRIRARGANVMIDGGRLIVINREKLPDGALDFIRQNGRAIAAFVEREGNVEERAAIIEHDGGMPRQDADRLARLLFANCPPDTNAADWTWFVNKALEIMDAAPMERAA